MNSELDVDKMECWVNEIILERKDTGMYVAGFLNTRVGKFFLAKPSKETILTKSRNFPLNII